MANTWGELSWNIGAWGNQNDVNVTLSGQGLSMPVPGNAQFVPVDGWGRSSWGNLSWNANYENRTVSLTGLGLNSSLNNVGISAEINEGWGRLTWGENAWGIAGDVLVTGIGLSTSIGTGSVTIDVQPSLVGQQLSLNLASVTAFGLAQVPVSGQQLTNYLGTVDPAPDVMLTGIGLTSSTGILDAYNTTGWGRLTFGSEVWGATGYWAFAPLTGISLSANLGTAVLDANTLVDLTGNNLVISEGIADPSPDATVVGIGLSASVALGSVIQGNANIDVTGISMSVNLGTAVLNAVTFASTTGQRLNFTLNNAVAGASALVLPTGVQANIALGNENIQSWQIVDTGSTVSYSEVSTGTSVIWNEIDTAA